MPETALQKPIPDYSRLSRADEALILKLAEDGRTQTEIAQLIGCSQPTVSDILRDFGDTRILARKRTHNRALDVANAAIEGSIIAANDGKPEAALELLDRLEVAPKRQVDSGKGTQVLIQIGMPGQPAGPDPVIDVPFASS